MAKSTQKYAFSTNIKEDAELIAWLDSLDTGTRSKVIREALYLHYRREVEPDPALVEIRQEMSDIKQMLKDGIYVTGVNDGSNVSSGVDVIKDAF